MKLAALLFALSFSAVAQQAPVPAASAPVGKPCSTLTKDATRIERARCVQDTKCANLTADATRIERARCERPAK